MLQEYLTLSDLPREDTGGAMRAVDYVWDVFYRWECSYVEWTAVSANARTVTGLPPSLSDDGLSSPDESEAEDDADGDWNAEECYKNDYPDQFPGSDLEDSDQGSASGNELTRLDDGDDHLWQCVTRRPLVDTHLHTHVSRTPPTMRHLPPHRQIPLVDGLVLATPLCESVRVWFDSTSLHSFLKFLRKYRAVHPFRKIFPGRSTDGTKDCYEYTGRKAQLARHRSQSGTTTICLRGCKDLADVPSLMDQFPLTLHISAHLRRHTTVVPA